MTEDVKSCVAARETFFETYYAVPEPVKPEVEAFLTELRALGEASANATDFEGAFMANGLSDKFNSLLTKCTPKAVTLTAEQKAYSKEVSKQLYKESGRNLGEEIANDVADSLSVGVEEELIAQSRKQMIAEGTFGEYTKVSNAVEDGKNLFGFVKGLFGKKK